ncbi:Coiled-coil domain-containing protein 42 [Hondaea fermentalgiana]|uniref:Coiled-coil domain-containing protein 42 n=1 Tax=Hondaea fermentalgiana TaxID=2315210 RepID=A0A2R5GMD4_9STRA|nr:Coiled-coil domain-containing protein 42 [Hondaea fermentalgiana]|eukprot:GBG32052.1 Coiled-coil domain-containing protein 42 [Hondaea fermentalgiana]
MRKHDEAAAAAATTAQMKATAQVPQALVLEHVSPATRLLEKRRQMFEVQEALDAQKEEFARREEAFHRREEGLRKKDLELQESLIKFNKFLQENESKRNRADKRTQEETKQRKSKEGDIRKLEKQLDAMRKERAELDKVVDRNIKYQRYLETVQETMPEDYPEVGDLLNRYQTLKDANGDLKERLQTYEDSNEVKRAEYVHYTKEQTNEILNFNNEIASMQKQLEQSESEAMRMQNEVDGQIRSISDRTLEIGQALMVVENLLQRCTSKPHGNFLKHFQASEEHQQSQQSSQQQSQQSPSESSDLMRDGESKEDSLHEGSSASRTRGRGPDELTRKGLAAMSQLDVIAAYIVDFESIVAEAPSHVN